MAQISSNSEETNLPSVLVTGGNSGIGRALCKLLATEHGCHVIMGARNPAKGKAALDGILQAHPEASGKIELLTIDVASEDSCAAAAEELRSKGVILYGLVNNAGVGLATDQGGGAEAILNTNYYGPKRVSEAMLDLIDPDSGRIVNVSSGVASMWVRDQDAATKALFSNPDLAQEELDTAVQACVAAGNVGMGGGYGLRSTSTAKMWPKLKVVSLSPGFIDTPMTHGFGARLTPEQGCVAPLRCLFGDVTSGFYYGSDGKRSPLTCTRDPGTPEYQGEAVPSPAVYNS